MEYFEISIFLVLNFLRVCTANFEDKKKRIFLGCVCCSPLYKKELFLKDLPFFLNPVFN